MANILAGDPMPERKKKKKKKQEYKFNPRMEGGIEKPLKSIKKALGGEVDRDTRRKRKRALGD